MHWQYRIRWYAVVRRRGLRGWVSWGSQRVVANSDRCTVRAVESDLLAVGQSIITALRDTTGQGDPECGEAFGHARAMFTGVTEALRSAGPDSGWDGTGSYSYADLNTRQQMRSEAMADADHEVQKVLCREAAQITLRRGYLDEQRHFLAGTKCVVPRSGDATRLAIEMAALQTALGESSRQMNQLQSEVAQNAADLQQAVGRYSGVADGAELPGAAAEAAPYSDRLHAPVAAKLGLDELPGPPAGRPVQDGK